MQPFFVPMYQHPRQVGIFGRNGGNEEILDENENVDDQPMFFDSVICC